MSSISEGNARSGIQSYETAHGRRWRIRYELPTKPDGQRRQRSKRGSPPRRTLSGSFATYWWTSRPGPTSHRRS
jgi:hypothetical protein